jgi:hypothetical protein
MSGSNIPQSLEALQQKANADFGALYQSLTNTFTEAKQRFGDVNRRLVNITQQLTDAHTEIAEGEVEVTTVQTELALTQPTPPEPHRSLPPPINQTPPQRSENMPAPVKFSRARPKLSDFLTQMRLKLMVNNDQFINENPKMMNII